MAFNTNNPLGSTDPRDLSDNAENLDRGANGTATTFTDRLGNSRQSWKGMEAEFDSDQAARTVEFNNYLVTTGYQFAGAYAAGIEITQYNQVLQDSLGEFWRASGSTTLPYTTTGAGLPEGGAFVAVGDATLRNELAQAVSTGGGATLVNGATIYVGSVAELEALSLAAGANVYLTEEGRAGEFVVKTGTPPSDPQKGIYIVLANGNYAMRRYDGISGEGGVNIDWFGPTKGVGGDAQAAVVQAISLCPTGATVYASASVYALSATITLNKRIKIKGAGAPAIDKSDKTGTVFFKNFNGDLFDQTVDGVVFEDFSVNGVAGNTGNGIWLHGSRPRCTRVHVYNQGGHGILVGNPSGPDNSNLWFLDNTRTVGNGGDGIRISSNEGQPAEDANAGTLIQSDSSGNVGDGVYIGQSRHNVLLNVTVQGNTGRGLYLNPNAKDTNVFGGDTDESNVGGNVLNEGVATRFFGVPNSGFTENGTETRVISRNYSKLKNVVVDDNISVLTGNAGAVDTLAKFTSLGNTQSGRGVGLDFYLPGDQNNVGAKMQFVRDLADLSSRAEILTKTNGGTPEVGLRVDRPGTGVLVDIPGLGLKRLNVGDADSGGPGFRMVRVSN